MAGAPEESGPHPEDLEREEDLARRLAALRQPVLAYSGGVDSSYLLAVAVAVRGARAVRPVIGVSPSLSRAQLEQARSVAAGLGARLEEMDTGELAKEGYRRNLGDRCYFCKDTLFETLRSRHPEAELLDGTNADDLVEHRPGLRAAREHGVLSPLAESGLGKDAIRRLSRARRLPTADLPASPCLASRIPAGLEVDEPALARIERAEAILRELGFRELRVRHHGDLARIEVPVEELPSCAGTELGAELVRRLKGIGYRFVTIDLEGFRSGSGSKPTSGNRT